MKPISFPEQNVVFAKDQPQYLPLLAHTEPDDPSGRVTSCWGLSLRERFKVFFTGRVWVRTLSFGEPLQPIKLQVNRPRMVA